MGVRRQQGFTIIEVSLFLAISALMAILLLGGWTAMINSQRYKDSNKTLQSFIQEQYSLVYNVQNSRSDDFKCDGSGNVTAVVGGQPRGQTECVLMGRYITVENSKELVVRPIIGVTPTDIPTGTDFDVINAFQPKRSDDELGLSQTSLVIPWGAEARGANGGTDVVNRAIAIIRSPTTGYVYTVSKAYSGSMPLIDPAGLLDPANQQDIVLCLDAGMPLSGGRIGVLMKKGASSSSAIETITEESVAGKPKC